MNIESLLNGFCVRNVYGKVFRQDWNIFGYINCIIFFFGVIRSLFYSIKLRWLCIYNLSLSLFHSFFFFVPIHWILIHALIFDIYTNFLLLSLYIECVCMLGIILVWKFDDVTTNDVRVEKHPRIPFIQWKIVKYKACCNLTINHHFCRVLVDDRWISSGFFRGFYLILLHFFLFHV